MTGSETCAGCLPGAHRPDCQWRAEVERLRETLTDVAKSAVVFDDERIGYIEVQIDRVVWRELSAITALPPDGEND